MQISGEVTVNKNGSLTAEGDGIDAEFEGRGHRQGRSGGQAEEQEQPRGEHRRSERDDRGQRGVPGLHCAAI